MTRPRIDLSCTDVIRMARETGVDIFVIYNCLELTLDPVSQGFRDRVWEAEDNEAWRVAVRAMLDYSISMGNESARREQIPQPDSVDEAEPVAVSLAKLRVQTGIPWGTGAQHEEILRKAEFAVSMEDLVELYEQIPSGAHQDQAAVLCILADQFFQPR